MTNSVLILGFDGFPIKSPTVKLNGVEISSKEFIDTLLGSDFNNDWAHVPLVPDASFVLYTFCGVEASEDLEISLEGGRCKVVYAELSVEP